MGDACSDARREAEHYKEQFVMSHPMHRFIAVLCRLGLASDRDRRDVCMWLYESYDD